MSFNGFPHDLNTDTDPIFQDRIRPFIESELKKLQEYDALRPADTLYIFHEHAHRVAEDMRRTCAHLGLPAFVCKTMYWTMLPHDIGKRLLPVALWDSEEKPTEEMKQKRRSHADLGLEIVGKEFGDTEHPFLALMKDIIGNHHEQMDGTGYRGLTGEQLSAPVKLACIIESFDGYQIRRPHFGDRDISTAGVLKRMREEKGAAFYDMELFEAFAEAKIGAHTRHPE